MTSSHVLPKRVWVLFSSLYTTQYIGIGFLSIAVMLILRDSGVELKKLSLIPLMSTPIALKVLWAPIVDKYLKTKHYHYRNWLLIAQFLMLLSLFLIAFINPIKQFYLMLFAIFVFSIMTATQDLALSGVICNVFDQTERYRISSVKTSGTMFGNIIGGGVVLLLYPYIKWSGCLLMISILLLITWCQLFFFNEYQYNRIKHIPETESKHYWCNIFYVWKGKKVWLFLLILIPFGILPSYNLVLPALVDYGWSLSKVAVLLKVYGSIISLLAIAMITKIIKQKNISRRKTLFYSLLCHSIALLSFLPISLGYANIVWVYFAFLLYFTTIPFVFISISAIIMDNVADSNVPSTAYNAQAAVGFILGFLVVSMSLYLAQQFGYFMVSAVSISIAFFATIFSITIFKNQK